MNIVSLSEDQIKQVQHYVSNVKDKFRDKETLFRHKCGEIAFLNYGLEEKLFRTPGSQDLCDTVLSLEHNGFSHGLVVEFGGFFDELNYTRVFADVHTVDMSYGYLPLHKDEYDCYLNRDNCFEPDIFVLVKQLSMSTYELSKFILKSVACNVVYHDFPTKYLIKDTDMNTFENIHTFGMRP